MHFICAVLCVVMVYHTAAENCIRRSDIVGYDTAAHNSINVAE